MTWSYPLAQRAGIFSLFLINDVGNLEMRRTLRFPGKAYEDLLSSTSNGALNLFSRVGWVGFGKAQNEASGGVWAAHAGVGRV